MAICGFCKKEFTKKHNKEKYCSEYCRKEARKEQNRNNFFRWYHRNKHKLSEDKRFGLGSGWITEHRKMDFEQEEKTIKNEKRRLTLI